MKKLPEDKVERGIVLYREDWDYLKALGKLLGNPPSRLLREFVHEFLGFLREIAPLEVIEGKDRLDLRVFVKTALSYLGQAMFDVSKLLEGDKLNGKVRLETEGLYKGSLSFTELFKSEVNRGSV